MFGFFPVKMLEIPVNQAHLIYSLMCFRNFPNPY
jgi:hypothetical protein